MPKKVILEGEEMEITTNEDVVRLVEENHIWLNAFACINPSKEQCEEVGRIIIEWLNEKDRIAPKVMDIDDLKREGITDEKTLKTYAKLAKLTPILYMSVNKS